jgi:hypothetical protein
VGIERRSTPHAQYGTNIEVLVVENRRKHTHLEVVRAGQQLGAGGDAVDLLRVLLPRILARQLAEL